MDDVWFGRGATRADVETCLRALSLHDKGQPPFFAVAVDPSDEGTPRLHLASVALFALFGVKTDEALAHRLFGTRDPGARRLAALSRGLTPAGAPRLERLRFFIGPRTEIITFLCRRIMADGKPLFIAAALGVRPGLLPAESGSRPQPEAPAPAPEPVADPSPPAAPISASMSIQAIQAALRARWPTSRTVRFLWQSDADLVCTQVTLPLPDVVGLANADLVGRNLVDLAPQIDPSGTLADALIRKETWSGIEVDWPIAGESAAVTVGLGAIPALDRDRNFEGYRGYGVIHLDRVVAHAPLNLQPIQRMEPSEHQPPANVVRFPRTRALSMEEQKTFATLGAELREEAGLSEAGAHPLEPTPDLAPVESHDEDVALSEPERPVPDKVADQVAPDQAAPDQTALEAPSGSAAIEDARHTDDEAHQPSDKRASDVSRHALAMLDRLTVGLLVTRDNVPIFANRHLLETLGFASEDDLHRAGGTTHLFGDLPGNASGSETVGIRHHDGHVISATARMQTIEWDGLPATLLTLHPVPDMVSPLVAPAPQSVEPVPMHSVADASEARELRAILETATDGVALIDADGNVTSLNRSGEALFGCDRGLVIGKPFLSLFASHNQSLAADYLDGLKSNAEKSLLNDGREILINAHPGGTIPVFMTLGRLAPKESTDERADLPRFCALFRDLTHWKKVERDLEAAKHEAEHANALKSDFLAKVSHEVRTPLNAIIGFAEVMMEERFGPIGNDRYKDYLRDIQTSGTHVMSLVNDLLDLSKIEAGKMDLAVNAIDANKVIGECVAIMQPQASSARVIMRLSLAQALPQIKADERSLRQIVLNLLSNAIKFNEPGGQVIVATAMPETGHVVIRIRDTGPGMSEADIAAALEPFHRLPSARPGSVGTGLGLPLTKALVEANQASFSIRSKVEQGTLVEVAFPPARVLAG